MKNNDDAIEMLERKRRNDLIKNFIEVKEQPKNERKGTVEKKGLKYAIAAVCAIGVISLMANLPIFTPKPIEPDMYSQYLEWVDEQRTLNPYFVINEETYEFFCENVYESAREGNVK